MIRCSNKDMPDSAFHQATEIKARGMGLSFGAFTARLATELGPFQQGSPEQTVMPHQDIFQTLSLSDQMSRFLSAATGLSVFHQNTIYNYIVI
jgi:hypothetical protein